MNTTVKGNQLESEINSLLSQLIEDDRFFASAKCCQVHRKRGYYSKDRKKNIVFDLSVEITLPGQCTYSILVLIECKNYGHKVPVDDVEEFYAKTQQISPANTKAIVVSNNAFQEGALNFARSKGIGLLRYFNKDSLEWVLTRSPSRMSPWATAKSDSDSAYNGLRFQDFVSRYFDCYGFVGDTCTNSLNYFFSQLTRFKADKEFLDSLTAVEQTQQPSLRMVPYKEREDIEAICGNLLRAVQYPAGAVSLEDLCGLLGKQRGLRVRRSRTLSPGVLGTISFSPAVIEIDELQAGSAHRTRFTLAHELGHLCLDHHEYMVREICQDSDVDFDGPSEIAIEDLARMEWQANYFASCLLLPRAPLLESFAREIAKHQLIDRGHGVLYLDDQLCNIDVFFAVTAQIMTEYCVSRSVVKIRLRELGLLNEPLSRTVAFVAPSIR